MDSRFQNKEHAKHELNVRRIVSLKILVDRKWGDNSNNDGGGLNVDVVKVASFRLLYNTFGCRAWYT